MPATSQQKTKTKTVRLPAKLDATIEELAAAREMNPSEFIRYAVVFYVDYTRQAG